MAGFSFEMKGGYEQGPLSPLMIRRILQWNGEEDGSQDVLLADAILSIVNRGGIPRDFRKWCESEEAPGCAHLLDRKWTEILFDSVALHVMSGAHLKNFEVSSSVLPWMLYSAPTVFCAPHAELDRFIARYNDPIWETVWPPNGWLCGCGVVPLMESDLGREKDLKWSVSAKVLAICTGWIDEPPIRIYSML